ncbi:MAG: HdeD family acid-resistance protein [Butyricicoccaceae bacterium]
MFEAFEQNKHRLRASSLGWIIAGLVLLIRPNTVIDLFCYVIGALIIAFGVIQILPYVTSRTFTLSAGLICVISVALGVFFISNSHLVASVLPLVIGIVMIADGISNLYHAIKMRRYDTGWTHILVVGLITFIFGLLITLNAYHTTTLVLRLMGAALLFNGISDLWIVSRISRAIRREEEATGSYRGDFIDVEAVPVDDDDDGED